MVTSVIKGNVQCRSCRAEWSSIDFVKSGRLERLRINELPHGVHSYAMGKHRLKRYDEYRIGFWRSLGAVEEVERKAPSQEERRRIVEFLLVAAAALVGFLPGPRTFDIG